MMMNWKYAFIAATTSALVFVFTMVVSGCGGGASDEMTDMEPTSGVAVDGYLSGAIVTCDDGDAWAPTASATKVITSSQGAFTFLDGCAHPLMLVGGYSTDTLLGFVGQLRAPAHSTVLSPLTTLLANGASNEKIVKAFGLAADTDIAHVNPAAPGSESNTYLHSDLFRKTLAAQQMLQKTTEVLAALQEGTSAGATGTQALYAAVAKAFSQTLRENDLSLMASPNTIDAAYVPSTFDAEQVAILLAGTLQRVHQIDSPVGIQGTIDSVGGVITLTDVIAPAMTVQANIYLAATDANLAHYTKQYQDPSPSATYGSVIARMVNTAKTSGVLHPAADTAAVTTLAQRIESSALAVPISGGQTVTIRRADGLTSTIAAPTTIQFDFGTLVKDLDMAFISVSAGSLGALTQDRTDPTLYTGTWTPPANAAGAARISMGSGPYTEGPLLFDLRYDTTTTSPITAADTILANFEEPNQNYGEYPAKGANVGISYEVTEQTNHMLNIEKPAGIKDSDGNLVTWAGAWYTLKNPIPFASNRTRIKARVYSSVANAPIKLKIEGVGAAPKDISTEEVSAIVGAANTWQYLEWDFTGLDTTKSYRTIAITPNPDTVPHGETYYFDDIALVAAPQAATNDYLYLDGDSVTYNDGAEDHVVTLADFERGIDLAWPMATTATLQFKLSQKGTFTLSDKQKTVHAAIEIQECTSKDVCNGGKTIESIWDVPLRQSGNALEITIKPNYLPSGGSVAINIYSASYFATNADTEAHNKFVVYFSARPNQEFDSGFVAFFGFVKSIHLNGENNTNFGSAVEYIKQKFTKTFSGIDELTGLYKVTVVISNLPLRKSNGMEFDRYKITDPYSVTTIGNGVVGYIRLK